MMKINWDMFRVKAASYLKLERVEVVMKTLPGGVGLVLREKSWQVARTQIKTKAAATACDH